MDNKYEQYRHRIDNLPGETLAWNMYGPGLESIGRNGEPERQFRFLILAPTSSWCASTVWACVSPT